MESINLMMIKKLALLNELKLWFKVNYHRLYYIQNSEVIKQQKRNYYIRNKEMLRERKKKWRKDNLEQYKNYNKQYYADNKQKMKEYFKKRNKLNKNRKSKLTDDEKNLKVFKKNIVISF